VHINTITEAIMPRKPYDQPRRIQVTVSDTLYITLLNHAHRLNLPISSYVNLILSGVVEWKYKIRAGEFNPDAKAAYFKQPAISDRLDNLNHKPTPEPMSDDAVDQACFKSYRDDSGQINNIKAWIEAGRPAPEKNR